MHKALLFLFLLIISCILLNIKFVENFEIVGYNNSNIPKYIIKNLYDTESDNLEVLFNKISKDKMTDTSDFILYSNYIEFPFNNIIKSFLSNYLTKIIGDKIQINTNINNMYWKDINQDRIFIFNINMINNTHFTTRQLKVKIIIHNIKNFIKSKNIQDYATDVNPQLLINAIDILSINLASDNYKTSTLIGIDQLNPNFYIIKNNLFLMDPFLTSGKDAIITDTMKKNFELSLIEHKKLADANKKKST